MTNSLTSLPSSFPEDYKDLTQELSSRREKISSIKSQYNEEYRRLELIEVFAKFMYPDRAPIIDNWKGMLDDQFYYKIKSLSKKTDF